MYHILICDDEKDIVNALKIYLTASDIKTFEASNGKEALEVVKEQVVISFKNTSRELLNISADELMERFVQGDYSRKSDGNGLGLSIARSLTELQNGTMELSVDGDLFKVVLCFPYCKDCSEKLK